MVFGKYCHRLAIFIIKLLFIVNVISLTLSSPDAVLDECQENLEKLLVLIL